MVARKVRVRLDDGMYAIPDAEDRPVVLSEYAPDWLKAQVHLKSATVGNYEYAFRVHVLPAFGTRGLAEINREAVRRFVVAKLEGVLKPNALKAILAPFRACLIQAVEDGLIPSNPAVKIGRLLGRRKADLKTDRPDPFSRDELAHLLAEARERYASHYPLLLFLARTGARRGEGLALEWPAVDFDRRTAMIEKGLSEGELTTPKSGKARPVDLSRELTAELQRLRDVQAAEAAFAGREPLPLVFPSKEGTYLDPGNIMHRVWNPLLRAAGLRHRGMHQLRHSFATILLAEGAPITYVAQQLGHASPRITMEVYAHWIPTSDRSFVDRLDGADATSIRNLRATENTKADHSEPAMIGLSSDE